jgi:tetratricopeptide (TPR) repeat protein
MKVKIRICCTFLMAIFSLNVALSQDRDVEIAHEYFGTGEYDKAKDMYERLSKNNVNLPYIYDNYLFTLLHFKQKEEAEKFIKRMIKVSEDNLFYKLDHYMLVREMNGPDKSEKEFSGIVSEIKNNQTSTEKAADYLLKKNLFEEAKTLLLASRKSLKNVSLYVIPLANIYYQQGNVEMTIEELLSYLKNNPEELENVRNVFQNNMREEKDLELLETKLYERIQNEPDEIAYNELLLWLNMQKKNFSKAYMQAKAIDKRLRAQGNKMMEVGRIAMENRDYENASRFFDYVIKEYPNGINYATARGEMIRAKEETIKNSFPIDPLKINSLIGDYLKMIKELGSNPATVEARRSVAQLYAFYLDKKDTAIIILNDAINIARNDLRAKCKAKIDLGDIYLLKGESWESTLLYSQVEKDMKEDPLGHEAKLRNAKLSYYKGEFDLAQEHLDVLKLATSREIANDAMELSILIQDNTGLDSTTEAMKEYSAIDLLLFQNKTVEALAKTDSMMKKFPDHPLTDELLWLQAKIYRKMGDYPNAIASLEKINTSYPDDILGDNALYTLGNIYEENLKDNAKAMEIYQRFMLKYPGSIFTVEARKRFRTLRGDKL